jgi:lipopolysaccharide export system protein LptA
MNFRKLFISVVTVLSTLTNLSAQENGSQKDSLVRLLSAQSMELIEKDGVDYRKVTGPARFLHNDTYLICDTALWNMSSNEIYAISNVKILQDQTVLTGDRLTYYIDRDLAEFRGTLVQLEDKDRNVLRTEHLDYNTKDSVAVFFNGGSMKDAEGQIIESRTGTYDSKIRTFTFNDRVNMFTDSVFVKSTTIVYDARTNVATFGFDTDTWQDDNMLSANGGWYDRGREIFLFRNNVHGMSDTQEGWADSLYYYRSSKNIELLGNAQVTDTTRDVSALAGRIFYTDSLSEVKLTRDPAVIGVMKNAEDQPDTVYFGADTIFARTYMMFQVNESEIKNSKSRMEDLAVDAVQAYRQKAAKEAAEAAAKAMENDPNRPKPNKKQAEETGAVAAAGEAAETSDAADASEAEASESDASESSDVSEAAETSESEASESSDVSESDETSEKEGDVSKTSESEAFGENGDEAADTVELAEGAPADSLTAKTLTSAKDSTAMAAGAQASEADSVSHALASLGSAAGSLSKPAGRLTHASDSLSHVADTLSHSADSLANTADSLTVAEDSLSAPKDSTKLNFITAIKNVKMFRKDIQLACDSLVYNDLDSLVRMYEKPFVWNEGNRQYSADSIYAVIKDRAMQKASLMSNAFIIVKEDSLCFDQIRATEMLAYFDTTGALTRFDALGEANAVFYLQEDSVYATVNKSAAKMLSARFLNGELDKVYYFDAAKNDGYPVAQMTSDERVLKGFDWQIDACPRGKQDITLLSLRASERSSYSARPRATFEYTDRYYPGYIPGIMKQIREGKVAKANAEARRKAAAKAKAAAADSLTVAGDSLSVAQDSLSLSPADSLGTSLPSVADSTKAATDSLSMSSDSSSVNAPVLDPSALKKAQRDSLRAARIAAREAKWARLDSLDAAKAKAAADKKAAKLRVKKLKQLKALKAREEKENARLEKYKAAYLKQKERDDLKAAAKAAREAAKAARDTAKTARKADDDAGAPEKSEPAGGAEKGTTSEAIAPAQKG